MSRKHVQPLPLRKTAAGIGTVGVIRHLGGKVFVTVEIFFGAYKIRLCAVQKLLCGKTPVGRLRDSGILGEKTLLAHCVHVSEGELDVIAGTGSMIAVNPMSNMSNAVGCAPVRGMLERGITVGLGTDGFTQSLPESAKALALMMRMTEGRPAVGLGEAARLMVRGNAGIASRLFGADIGVLREGAAADVIILGGRPLTPLDADNADDQLIFGMSASNCRMTMAAGRLLMLDGKLLTLDEEELRRQISETAKALWKRLEAAAPFEWKPPLGTFL